jgi:hypothetical protein
MENTNDACKKKLSKAQKRKLRRKKKKNYCQTQTCPICLDDIKDNSCKLDCGHKIHNSCIEKFVKHVYKNSNLIAVKTHGTESISMFLAKDSQIIKCPLCRCEYTATCSQVFNAMLKNKCCKPQKILGKISFVNESNGEVYCHHITKNSDYTEYLHQKDYELLNNDDTMSDSGYNIISIMKTAIENNINLHMIKCPCTNKTCPQIIPMPHNDKFSKLVNNGSIQFATIGEFTDSIISTQREFTFEMFSDKTC